VAREGVVSVVHGRSPDRFSSPRDAVARIADGGTVFLHSGCAEPQTLVDALVQEQDRWTDLHIITGLQGSTAPYAQPACSSSFHPHFFMVNRSVTKAVEQGLADYLPYGPATVPDLLQSRWERLDAALIQVSPPDGSGVVSLGVTVGYTKVALSLARFVIAEVNETMPRTRGDSLIPESELDVLVESDRAVLQVPPPEPTGVLDAIGSHVVALIPSGATIQVGVGRIADGVWRRLKDHDGVYVCTGALSDAAAELVASGVGGTHPLLGPAVTSQLIGTTRLYELAHDNPNIELHQVSRTHAPSVLAQIGCFTAVNSALEVDLRGQANLEFLGGARVSGVGGAFDYALGAHLSAGGASIVALPSMSRGVSRIVPALKDPVVTVPAQLVDFVVTEHGIADLRSQSARERAVRLIAIADPSAHESLERALRDGHR
jgi:4-hydroxybutyrate CoA-transferase